MTLLALLAASSLIAPAQGLQIKELAPGKGPAAQVGDFLSMEYKGTLVNGKVFDQNDGNGKPPFKFMLGAGMVIKGWDQGLVGLKEGGRRKLTIPAKLGYGDQENGDIPANSTLIFEVKLVKIERATFTTLKAGTGPGAKFGDSLIVHYKGMFTDGKVFDQSYGKQPMPVDLPGRVIPGFTQGLIGIKKGEKRKVTIPPSLGYGERGAGGVIPPNATLVFEVELVELKQGSAR